MSKFGALLRKYTVFKLVSVNRRVCIGSEWRIRAEGQSEGSEWESLETKKYMHLPQYGNNVCSSAHDLCSHCSMDFIHTSLCTHRTE